MGGQWRLAPFRQYDRHPIRHKFGTGEMADDVEILWREPVYSGFGRIGRLRLMLNRERLRASWLDAGWR